jgi:hypothetical protein
MCHELNTPFDFTQMFVSSSDSAKMTHVIDILPRPDRSVFLQLKEQLSAPETRFNRNSTLDTLKNQINSIRQFCIRHDAADWRRCLACGVCWLDDESVAVNTHRLGWLIGKGKSTLNANLIMTNYNIIGPVAKEVVEAAMPALKGSVGELRHWTVRRCPADVTDVGRKKQWPKYPRVDFESIFTKDIEWEFIQEDEEDTF